VYPQGPPAGNVYTRQGVALGKLTDVAIRAWIRSGERSEGRSDGVGLVLTWREKRTAPSWRLRYRFAGKPRVMENGSYSDLTLAATRQAAKELRAKIALGHDVAGEKQERKSTALARIEATRSVTTVGQLADEYFERMINGRWKHPNIVRSRIEKDIKPHLGKLALDAVEPRHIDAMLRAVVKRGAPTIANDVLRWVRRMFDYAIKRHLVRFNPAAAFDLADAGFKELAREPDAESARRHEQLMWAALPGHDPRMPGALTVEPRAGTRSPVGRWSSLGSPPACSTSRLRQYTPSAQAGATPDKRGNLGPGARHFACFA
jgi:Arm DNA-binding domain